MSSMACPPVTSPPARGHSMGSYSKELLKGAADTLVLSSFRDGEKYGYQVVKELELRSEGFFCLKEGTLYPALHKLENEGLVESYEGVEKGRQRRYYRITNTGRGTLAKDRAEWRELSKAVTLILGEA